MSKKTIIEYIIEKLKKKPTTQEDIEQLKLELEAACLKRDIAKAKSQTGTWSKDLLNLFSQRTSVKDLKL